MDIEEFKKEHKNFIVMDKYELLDWIANCIDGSELYMSYDNDALDAMWGEIESIIEGLTEEVEEEEGEEEQITSNRDIKKLFKFNDLNWIAFYSDGSIEHMEGYYRDGGIICSRKSDAESTVEKDKKFVMKFFEILDNMSSGASAHYVDIFPETAEEIKDYVKSLSWYKRIYEEKNI